MYRPIQFHLTDLLLLLLPQVNVTSVHKRQFSALWLIYNLTFVFTVIVWKRSCLYKQNTHFPSPVLCFYSIWEVQVSEPPNAVDFTFFIVITFLPIITSLKSLKKQSQVMHVTSGQQRINHKQQQCRFKNNPLQYGSVKPVCLLWSRRDGPHGHAANEQLNTHGHMGISDISPQLWPWGKQ